MYQVLEVIQILLVYLLLAVFQEGGISIDAGSSQTLSVLWVRMRRVSFPKSKSGQASVSCLCSISK